MPARPGKGLIHHSDRGSTYASGDYRKALRRSGLVCRLSRRWDCWNDAVADSFFSSFTRQIEEIKEIE